MVKAEAEKLLCGSLQRGSPTTEGILFCRQPEMSTCNSGINQRIDPAVYYREFIKNGVRIDGRSFSDLRCVAVGGNDFSCSSECGSSLVHFGNTKVACSISVLVGTPSQLNPSSGDIVFDVSLWPLCNLKYDQRSKPDEAFLLEQVLHDLVVKGRLIDLTQLEIERGRYAFRLNVKVMCISEDGNLTDAAVLAVIKAIMNMRLPKAIVTETVAISVAETTQLVLSKAPISVTLGLFDNIFITDPNAKEEEIIRGRITCAIAEDDSICLLSQSITSGKGLTPKQLNEAILICRQKAIEIRAALAE